jgi:hypothetical protein
MYQAWHREAEAEMAQRWAAAARPVVHDVSHAELEERHWGPGGRARFTDPRPGDFPGRGARPHTENEKQDERWRQAHERT